MENRRLVILNGMYGLANSECATCLPTTGAERVTDYEIISEQDDQMFKSLCLGNLIEWTTSYVYVNTNRNHIETRENIVKKPRREGFKLYHEKSDTLVSITLG